MLSEMSSGKEKELYCYTHMWDIKLTETANKLRYRQQNGGCQRKGQKEKKCKGVKNMMTEGD